MQRRHVTAAQFELIRETLHNVRIVPGKVPVTHGDHGDHGETILFQETDGPFTVMVQDATALDQWLEMDNAETAARLQV